MGAMRTISTLVAAASVVVGTVVAAPAAGAAEAVDCSANKFAVGGWPAPQVVPAGYTAVPTPGGLFPWERGGYNYGQRVGAENVVSTLDAFAAACPGVDVELRGHSYGAAITSTALETIDGRGYASDVHVYQTGNPRRAGGVEDRFRGITFLGITFRGAARVPVNVGSYVDVCNPNDGICNLPYGAFLRGVLGYFTGAHRY